MSIETCESTVDTSESDAAISEAENEYAQNEQLHDARSALAALKR